MSQSLLRLWVASRVSAGTKVFADLVAALPDPEDIYQADAELLCGILGEHCRDVRRLLDKETDSVERLVEFCSHTGIRVLTWWDAEYPSAFRALSDPPAWIFLRGELPMLERKLSVGIVGTRQPSEYGIKMTFELASDLAAAGAITVSGLALGIDGVAAAGTLDAKGETVAVLGCGPDICYPSQHKALLSAVEAHGAVITEFPPGTDPERWNFPKRNRLISALSDAVIVTEGSLKSGSLITAEHAKRQGKPLYALPGNVDSPGGEGPMKLLRQGARPISCAEDLLSDFEEQYAGEINVFRLLNRTAGSAQAALGRYGVVTEAVKRRRSRRGDDRSTAASLLADTAPPKEKHDASASLTGDLLTVYRRIPEDSDCVQDELVGGVLDAKRVGTALTMLELRGCIRIGAGGRIRRI